MVQTYHLGEGPLAAISACAGLDGRVAVGALGLRRFDTGMTSLVMNVRD